MNHIFWGFATVYEAVQTSDSFDRVAPAKMFEKIEDGIRLR